MVGLCLGVFVCGCEDFLGERRMDRRLAMVGILDLGASSGAMVGARLFVDMDRVRPCLAGDVVVECVGMAGSGLSSCACDTFDGDMGAAAEGRETDRMDFTLFERGRADGLFGVDVVSATRAVDAFVGDKSLVETGCGSVVGLLEDMSSSSILRKRLAGASASRGGDAGMDLNGLIDVGRPMTGGGILVAELFPAVLGRSGSSRSALEEDRFKDCSVGLAKAGLAR